MMKYILFIILSLIMVGYLLYQSKEDIKDKTVPVLPNYIAIGVSAILYFIGCLCTWSIPDIKGIFTVIFFLACICFFKVFSIGDAKAFLAISFISAFTIKQNMIFHAKLDLFFIELVYIFAMIFFIPVNVIKSRKSGMKWKDILYGKNPIAFFPYITIGYICASVFCIKFSYI